MCIPFGNVDPGFINAPRIMTFVFPAQINKGPQNNFFLGGGVVVVGYSLLL